MTTDFSRVAHPLMERLGKLMFPAGGPAPIIKVTKDRRTSLTSPTRSPARRLPFRRGDRSFPPTACPRCGRKSPGVPPPQRSGPCRRASVPDPRGASARSPDAAPCTPRPPSASTDSARLSSPAGPPTGHTISRSVRRRPRPYSRSIRPPLLTMRCRNACNSNCGPASLYWNRSTQCSECSRKNSWNAASSLPAWSTPASSTYQAGS